MKSEKRSEQHLIIVISVVGIMGAIVALPMWVWFIAQCVKIATSLGWLP